MLFHWCRSLGLVEILVPMPITVKRGLHVLRHLFISVSSVSEDHRLSLGLVKILVPPMPITVKPGLHVLHHLFIGISSVSEDHRLSLGLVEILVPPMPITVKPCLHVLPTPFHRCRELIKSQDFETKTHPMCDGLFSLISNETPSNRQDIVHESAAACSFVPTRPY